MQDDIQAWSVPMECIYVVEDDVSIQEIEIIALKNSNYDVQAFSCAADFFCRA